MSAVFTETTGHGPASITVTGVTLPVSSSKSWVMPSFLPTIPFTPRSRFCGQGARSASADEWRGYGGTGRFPHEPGSWRARSNYSQLDLDIHARRQVEPHQRVDRLRGR